MILSKAAVAGMTGVVGVVLGLTMGITGANAVSHHNQDRGMSHSVKHDGQQGQGRQKDFTGNQSGEQRHKRPAPKDDNTQQSKPGDANQQNSAPNTNSAPTTK